MLLNQIQITAEEFRQLSEIYWLNPAQEIRQDIHTIMYHLIQTGTPNSPANVADMCQSLEVLYKLFSNTTLERFLLDMNESIHKDVN